MSVIHDNSISPALGNRLFLKEGSVRVKWLIKLNNWINREVVWRVYGLLGGELMARHFLLLRTRGRKTGNVRTVMITYLRENTTFLVIASNGGQTRMPAWYHNLRAHSQAEIQVGKQRFQMNTSDFGLPRARVK
jgi:hypothetical protein